MKKFVFIILFAFSIVSISNAQSNALGLRLGGGIGGGAEASFQLGLNDANRVEFGLGLDIYKELNALHASAVYQWVFDLSELEAGFNWYTGIGGGLLSYSGKHSGGTSIGLLGIIGIEYNFEFPLRLSLDYRPGYYFGSDVWDPFRGGAALGVRFRF